MAARPIKSIESIPTPAGSLPLIGHTLLLARDGGNPQETWLKMHEQYGVRFFANLPGNPRWLMTSDPDDVSIIGRGQGEFPHRDIPLFPWDKIWARNPERPVSFTWLQGYPWKNGITIFKDSLYRTEIAIPRYGRSIMSKWVSTLMARMKANHNSTTNVIDNAKTLYRCMITDASMFMSLGKDPEFLVRDKKVEPELDEFFTAVAKLGPITLECMLNPLTHIMDTEPYRVCDGYWHCMYNQCEKWYKEMQLAKKANGDKWPANTDKSGSLFLDMMERKERGECDDARVVFNAVEFVIGFQDPGSQLMENIIYQLALRQESQQEVFEELVRVLGSGPVDNLTIDQWENLKVFRAFICEVCRFQPLFSMHNRHTTVPCQLSDGTYVPMDTKVVVTYAAMCKNPEAYPQPDEFMADRFLPNPPLPGVDERTLGGEARGPCPYSPGKINKIEAFCPFGLGHRRCAGIGYALVITCMSVAMIIREWKVTWHGPHVDWREEVPNHPVIPISEYFRFEPRA